MTFLCLGRIQSNLVQVKCKKIFRPPSAYMCTFVHRTCSGHKEVGHGIIVQCKCTNAASPEPLYAISHHIYDDELPQMNILNMDIPIQLQMHIVCPSICQHINGQMCLVVVRDGCQHGSYSPPPLLFPSPEEYPSPEEVYFRVEADITRCLII